MKIGITLLMFIKFFIFLFMTSYIVAVSVLIASSKFIESPSFKFISWTILILSMLGICMWVIEGLSKIENDLVTKDVKEYTEMAIRNKKIRENSKAATRNKNNREIAMEEARKKKELRVQDIRNKVSDIMGYLEEVSRDDRYLQGYLKTNKPGQLTTIEKEAIGKVKFKENQEGNTDCFVCLDPFVEGIDVSVLSCEHRFHSRCLDKWLEVKDHCPACRATQKIE